MIHGFGGSSDGFQKIYSDLAKDHTIISVDALGFGRSSKPMDFIILSQLMQICIIN